MSYLRDGENLYRKEAYSKELTGISGSIKRVDANKAIEKLEIQGGSSAAQSPP